MAQPGSFASAVQVTINVTLQPAPCTLHSRVCGHVPCPSPHPSSPLSSVSPSYAPPPPPSPTFFQVRTDLHTEVIEDAGHFVFLDQPEVRQGSSPNSKPKTLNPCLCEMGG